MSSPVVVTHAYDARNQGDGLLVYETLRALERVGISNSECLVVAIEASSFDGNYQTIQYPGLVGGPLGRLKSSPSLLSLSVGAAGLEQAGNKSEVWRAIQSARLIVGVGGGYLRAPGGLVSIRSHMVHATQLIAATFAECPVIYMPQSIGPLRGKIGKNIASHIGKLDSVLLRDDRSCSEVGGRNVSRVPDLAVLRIGRTLSRVGAGTAENEYRKSSHRSRMHGGEIVGIARPLPGFNYESRLIELDTMLPIDWFTHSSAGKQHDGAFYETIGVKNNGPTNQAFRSGVARVVVSVRLHGALQAILAGIPAIHLSYGRKGFGAFSDLGLEKWLHNARSFSPSVVAAQVEELRADSAEYWDCVDAAKDRLMQADAQLIDSLRRLAS